MTAIVNPILRGFNPDPSIVRVGADFYIATSTFEWFPGVQIHHSRDLVHWRLIGHILTRAEQLDLRGVPDSGGVWAPSLSYADGQFWLVHTNVRTRASNFKDIGVYLSTAPEILGPWTAPVFLNAIGFDPSLFHDDDGRKWIVNLEWDFRKGRPRFGGIVIQEYDPGSQALIGPVTKIQDKQGILTEGPNLYRQDGWYYLMLAEGGTGWNHGISLARSRSLLGPYELDPQASLLTSRDDPGLALQKAGHGELVQTPAGEWYLAHLASRPIAVNGERRCMRGRETCLQRIDWPEDGWPRLAQGGWHPQVELPAPAGLAPAPWTALAERDDFDQESLDVNWSTLRVPADETWLSLRERPGWLRLRGRDCQHSLFHQSLVARRLQSYHVIAETCLDFQPTHFTEMAGLICWYDTATHYYLRVTQDGGERVLGIVLTDDGAYDELADSQISIADWPLVWMRAEINGAALQFTASPDGVNWRNIGPILDASKLSDDYGRGLHFTGAFIGLCAQDLSNARAAADFDYFTLSNAG
jgi:xylan 1,4-beta-xylosidase